MTQESTPVERAVEVEARGYKRPDLYVAIFRELGGVWQAVSYSLFPSPEKAESFLKEKRGLIAKCCGFKIFLLPGEKP